MGFLTYIMTEDDKQTETDRRTDTHTLPHNIKKGRHIHRQTGGRADTNTQDIKKREHLQTDRHRTDGQTDRLSCYRPTVEDFSTRGVLTWGHFVLLKTLLVFYRRNKVRVPGWVPENNSWPPNKIGQGRNLK